MKEKIQPNPQKAPTQDAQVAAESMLSDQESVPEVDFEADYDRAQQMSRASSDMDDEGDGNASA